MSLILTSVGVDTFAIASADENALESDGQLLLHPGDLHEGIPYEVRARFAGRRVPLSVIEAASRLDDTADAGLPTDATAAALAPPDNRMQLACRRASGRT